MQSSDRSLFLLSSFSFFSMLFAYYLYAQGFDSIIDFISSYRDPVVKEIRGEGGYTELEIASIFVWIALSSSILSFCWCVWQRVKYQLSTLSGLSLALSLGAIILFYFKISGWFIQV